jgi:hypothetical protein
MPFVSWEYYEHNKVRGFRRLGRPSSSFEQLSFFSAENGTTASPHNERYHYSIVSPSLRMRLIVLPSHDERANKSRKQFSNLVIQTDILQLPP